MNRDPLPPRSAELPGIASGGSILRRIAAGLRAARCAGNTPGEARPGPRNAPCENARNARGGRRACAFLAAAVLAAAGTHAQTETLSPARPAIAVPAVRLDVDPQTVPAGEPVSLTAVLTPPAHGATFWFSLPDHTRLGGGADVGTITTRFPTPGRHEVRVAVLAEHRFLHASAVIEVTPKAERPADPAVPEPGMAEMPPERRAEQPEAQPAPPPPAEAAAVVARVIEPPPMMAAPAPVRLTLTPPAGPDQAGRPVEFSVVRTPPLDRMAFEFDPGDGSQPRRGEGNRVTHVYLAAGQYVAAVRLLESEPDLAARTPVAIGPATVPTLEADPRDAETGEPVAFKAAYPTPGDRVRFRFTFGGETTAWREDPVLTRTFGSAGRLAARVEVGLADGDRVVPLAASEPVGVAIRAPAPVSPPALLAVPTAPEVGQIVNFAVRFRHADRSTRYRFRFGEGVEPGPWTSQSRTARTFDVEGRVPVTVEAGRELRGEVRPLATSTPVVVDVRPPWEMGVTLAKPAPAGEPATFAVVSNRPDLKPRFTAVFDDGSPPIETGELGFSHLFRRAGPARVVVGAVAGVQQARAVIDFEVAPAAPPVLRADPPTGDVGQEIRWVATHPAPGARYRFSFGDGEAAGEWSPEPAASHRYAARGRFACTVEVGLPGPDDVAVIARSAPVFVVIGPPLQIEIGLEAAPVVAGREAWFRVATNPPDRELPLVIDFGDGSPPVSSAQGRISHVYGNAGGFRVIARSTDPARAAGAELAVAVEKPQAGFGRIAVVALAVACVAGGIWSAWRFAATKPEIRIRFSRGPVQIKPRAPLAPQWAVRAKPNLGSARVRLTWAGRNLINRKRRKHG